MAGGAFFALLDDISVIMDDVAVMSKVALQKTAGIIGDDIAVNAEQASGKHLDPKRELPIVGKIAAGSLVNKAILIPIGLAINVFAPYLMTPLLMCGGAYLSFEGAEKILHALTHKKGEDPHKGTNELGVDRIEDPKAYENKKRRDKNKRIVVRNKRHSFISGHTKAPDNHSTLLRQHFRQVWYGLVQPLRKKETANFIRESLRFFIRFLFYRQSTEPIR